MDAFISNKLMCSILDSFGRDRGTTNQNCKINGLKVVKINRRTRVPAELRRSSP